MDTRASTRTRLSAVPVLFALLLNMIVPVITAAVPSAVPEPLQATVAEAAVDPEHVSFTLEGCRNPSVNLETTNFVCADADYTTGNLGKTWNELDLVPHRLTTELGTQSSATETYTIGIAADYLEGGIPGYDVVGVPVVNTRKSDASCSISVVPGADDPDGTPITPGVGGTDTSLGRQLTITQAKGTTCVFDWTQRLAIGSHLYPGSSLHTNRTNQQWSTSGIGAADVSIPVKEILPQKLSKDMSAQRGQAYAWSIEKSAEPASLNFANTCLTTPGARSQDVDITITWTRSGPNASGDTTITTHVYATNPAHRSILVSVVDKIYEGAGQTTLLETASGGPVSVPAGAVDQLIFTHTFVYSGSATSFNDVATASYVDEDLGVAVPGQTTAAASATTKASTAPAVNSSVLVTDTESITGSGLSFSVAAPSVGSFTNYTADAETTGPVNWSYTATNSGSVTFTKTVYVDGPRVTSGTLSDTATITGDRQTVLGSDSASVAIETDALVSLTINKTIPAGSLRSGESVTFDFDITGPGNFADTASITFTHGDPLTKSTSLSDLAPGEYTVSEQPQANWADHTPQTEEIKLPDCDGSVSFNNSTLAPDLSITKEAHNDPVDAGDPIGFSIVVSNDDEAGTGVAKDVELNDPLPGSSALGVSWELDAVLFNGTAVNDPSAYCDITGSAPSQTLECELGDLDPGDSVEVQISSETSADNGCTMTKLENTATAEASNHKEMTAYDSVTINCPDATIEKESTTPVVNAGDQASFTITVTAAGTGTSEGVKVKDILVGEPGDWSLAVAGADDSACGIAKTQAQPDVVLTQLFCDFGDLAAGTVITIALTYQTDADDCPSITNRALVESDNDTDGSNNISETVTITVNCPDVTVDKEAVESPVSAGEQGQFTIEVSNAGPGTAYDVVVTDTAPEGTVWTVLDDGDFDCDDEVVGDQQTITCELDELAAGAAKTILIGYETDQEDCGRLDNAVAVAADNEPQANTGNNSDEASIAVECPGLNVDKQADADPIDAGEEASFTITVWNAGPGTAFDVELEDELPAGLAWDFEVLEGNADCDIASSMVNGGVEHMSIDCDLGDLEKDETVVIRVFADTDRADCGLLENTAFADATNGDEVSSSDEIEVKCPTIELDKENDADEPVLPGTEVTYTLTLTVDDGPAEDVEVVDELPAGITDVTNISDGGVYDDASHTITWSLGDLADGEYTLSYGATVADDVEHGDELVNVAEATSANSQCPDAETLGPECEDDSTVTVRVPTLVIDKVASAETIVISGEAGDLEATPSVVTWTLTYTLTNGPVSNAVITDEIPTGFVFLDAADGGTFADGSVTWTFPTLTESGSVTFRTTVDPETISRVAPTVNVAVIDSDETEPDEGEDDVTVTVEPPVLGGNPTPTPKPSTKPLPDTAAGIGIGGEPVSVPVELLAVLFLGSLGTLGLANVRARNRRR